MKKLSNIDSLYRPIATFGNISLEHRVNLFEQSKVIGEKNVPYKKDFTSARSKGGMVGCKSSSFRTTKDALILKGMYNNKEEVVKIPPSAYISYRDIYEIKKAFKIVHSWFHSDIKNDLFQYENNIPYKISEKYEGLVAIATLKAGIIGGFLAIQPYVISDALNNIGYPGVILKCKTGIIGTCSVSEFMSLGTVLIKNLENLYEISINLMNHYMLQEEV